MGCTASKMQNDINGVTDVDVEEMQSLKDENQSLKDEIQALKDENQALKAGTPDGSDKCGTSCYTMASIIEKIKSYDLPPELRKAIEEQNDLLLAKCARPTACRAAPPAAFTPQLARAQALLRRGPAPGRRWRPPQADTAVPGIGALQRERAGIAAVEVRRGGEHEGKVL